MKKTTDEFTAEEKELMNMIAVNYIIAQSDGFQLGYATAIDDFTNYIIDYWNSSDDKPQKSVLDALVDLGDELRKRKSVVENNIKIVKERGYEDHYLWNYKCSDAPFGRNVRLFTRGFDKEDAQDEG